MQNATVSFNVTFYIQIRLIPGWGELLLSLHFLKVAARCAYTPWLLVYLHHFPGKQGLSSVPAFNKPPDPSHKLFPRYPQTHPIQTSPQSLSR